MLRLALRGLGLRRLARLLRPLLRSLARGARHRPALGVLGWLGILRKALLRLRRWLRRLLRGEELTRLLLTPRLRPALRRLLGVLVLLGTLGKALLRPLRSGLLRPGRLEQLPCLLLRGLLLGALLLGALLRLVRGEMARLLLLGRLVLGWLVLGRVRIVLRRPLELRLPLSRGLLGPRSGWLTALRRRSCGASVRVLAHVQHCDDHPACWIPPAPHQEK